MNHRFLYGTKNPAKLTAMQRRLAPLGIELIGVDIPEVEEDGFLRFFEKYLVDLTSL